MSGQINSVFQKVVKQRLLVVMNMKKGQEKTKNKQRQKHSSNKVKFIEPTLENLGYLQEIYEKNKSNKARKR